MSLDVTPDLAKLFDVPNLDDLTTDYRPMRQAAAVLRLLANYADVKADAMGFRKAGDIADAIVLEKGLERRYAELPAWAKW